MGKRLALVLLEQQAADGTFTPPQHWAPHWPGMGALFSPWSALQNLAHAWMQLFSGWWTWVGTPLLRGI